MRKTLIVAAAILGFVLGAAVIVQARSNNDPPPRNAKLESYGLEDAPKKEALRLADSGEQLSLIDDGTTRCAIDSLGSGPCSTAEVIERGASVEVTLCEDNLSTDLIRAYGVAPSETRSVVINYDNGKSYDGQVGGEVFGIESPAFNQVDSLPETLTFTLQNGTTIETALPVVQSAYKRSCHQD